MKKSIFYVFISIIFIGNGYLINAQGRKLSSIAMDVLNNDFLSVRAIVVDGDKVFFGGSKNQIGFINYDFVYNRNNSKLFEKNRFLYNDTLKFEFRSIAVNDNNVFVASIGNPAFVYKIPKNFDVNLANEIVYKEYDNKVFYDSMKFWNNKEGIAVGDPIDDCFSIITTKDGGNSWQKTPCNKLPKTVEGEAAFATSNTNIVIKGNKTWIVSGGKKSRVFYSPNKGKKWKVYDTPIVQGETMTGIFTADFYNNKIGFIAGGNYDKQNQNFQNKALTTDGGKTWTLVAENSGFGHASCVQFVPEGKGNELVCVGASGIYYSNDMGNSWEQLSDDKSFYTIRFVDKNKAIVAGKNKIAKIVLK